MKKVKQSAITLLILFWVGLNQLYWALAPHIATYNNAEGLHTSVNHHALKDVACEQTPF